MENLKLSNIASKENIEKLETHFDYEIPRDTCNSLIYNVLFIMKRFDDWTLFDYSQEEINNLKLILSTEDGFKELQNKLVKMNIDLFETELNPSNQPVFIMVNRSGYSPVQVKNNTITVYEFIEYLRDFDENQLLIFNNDNGYTYGEVYPYAHNLDEVEDDDDDHYVVLETSRTKYSPEEVKNTSTIGEMIAELTMFSEDSLIILSNDNGYTYGYINESTISQD